jgi:hypothetical protein
MTTDLLILYLLLGSNALVYGLLAVGVARSRKGRVPKNPSVEDAFRVLELSLFRAFPDLPPGFTWNEVMEKIRALNLDLDWFEIENTFQKYVDFRYGGIKYRNANVDAILRLAARLPRGEKSVGVTAEVKRT